MAAPTGGRVIRRAGVIGLLIAVLLLVPGANAVAVGPAEPAVPAVAPEPAATPSPALLADRTVTLTSPDGHTMSFQIGSDYAASPDGLTFTADGGARLIVGEFAFHGTLPQHIGNAWARQVGLDRIPMTDVGTVHGMPATSGHAYGELGGTTPGVIEVVVFERPEGAYVITGVAAQAQQDQLINVDLPRALETLTIRQ